ncbi:MAG: alpha/beta fold hydrolase [Candidatus Aminicenantes bacterium]|nr:alpha/beta fold hydrolase [Candidatus Aminicenantes bacterium]
MKRSATILLSTASLMALAAVTFVCLKSPAIQEPGHGESVLAKVVRIEPELITSIPPFERFCDRIKGLDKRRIDVGGAELYVELEGKAVPLILINGGPGGTHHYFHPWFSRARRYGRVIYYDQRGCGVSDFKPGENGYSVEQAVEDLNAIRTILGIEKWVLLGYSYGGFLAQLYTILHPENVLGLILLGASPGMNADLGPSRQGDYISDREKNRLAEVRRQVVEYAMANVLPWPMAIRLMIYNNLLNGDWKRQHFYRPTQERLSQMALYEWVNDLNFNETMSRAQGRWDFTGAFQGNPIPTLILEGRWDLTWSEKKRDILKGNHPNGRMVVFEKAAHGIFDEQPDDFFRVLRGFITGLPKVDEKALSGYRAFLDGFVAEMRGRPDVIIGGAGWGIRSSREITAKYTQEWLERFSQWRQFLRVGFALYDCEKYSDALAVFERLEAKLDSQPGSRALGLLWQGHMLDLMGRRLEALARYRKVAEMDISDSMKHSQYGLDYELSPFARERLKTPFKRIENRSSD